MGELKKYKCNQCGETASVIHGGTLSSDMKPMVCNECKEIVDTVIHIRRPSKYFGEHYIYRFFFNYYYEKWDTEKEWNERRIKQLDKWNERRIKRLDKTTNDTLSVIDTTDGFSKELCKAIKGRNKLLIKVSNAMYIVSKRIKWCMRELKDKLLKEDGEPGLIVCPLCYVSVISSNKKNHLQEHIDATNKEVKEIQELELELSKGNFLCALCNSKLVNWDGIHCPSCSGEMIRYNLFEKILVD
jgi:DNA-directed RNA polymerase subunit RPC12/RpoP